MPGSNVRGPDGLVHAIDIAPSSLAVSPGMTDCCTEFLWDRWERTDGHVTCLMCALGIYYAGGPGWATLV